MSYAFRSFLRGQGREDGEPDTINHEAAHWNNFTTESTREQFIAYAVRQGMDEDQARQATNEKFAAVAAERRAIHQSALTRQSSAQSGAGTSSSNSRGASRTSASSGKTFESHQWENAYQNLQSRGYTADFARSIIEVEIQKENNSRTGQDQVRESSPIRNSTPRGRYEAPRREPSSQSFYVPSFTRSRSTLPARHLEYMEELVSRGQTPKDAEEVARLLYEREKRQGTVVTETLSAYRIVPAGSRSDFGYSTSRSRSPLPPCYQDQVEAAIREGVDRRQAEAHFRGRYERATAYGQEIREHGGCPVAYVVPGTISSSSRTKVTTRQLEDENVPRH